MMPTPCWPPITTVPPFPPPSKMSFNSGSLGSSSSLGSEDTNMFWSNSCMAYTQSVFTSAGFIFNATSEMSYSSEVFLHANHDNGFAFNADHNEDIKDGLVLEPVPLATLPPEPVVTDEEFEKEIDLMMMDSDTMEADPSLVHDLVPAMELRDRMQTE